MNMRHIIAIIGYWIGIDALFYWLNRRAKRVLTFHNVMPDEMMIKGIDTCITDSFSDFKKMIGWIGKKFKFSVDVDDPKTVTITFDDGYKNEYEIAGKWLMSQNIPAIMFTSGQVINAKAEDCLWIDKRELEKSGVKMEDLPEEAKRLRYSGITNEDIGDMRAHGWKVGWHTITHRPLGAMSEEEQRKELSAPKEFIKEPMSYPFGMWDTVSEKTIKVAEELGYPCAFSNDSYYTPSLRGNYYRMRFAPAYNKYEVHFLLSGLKYFMQSGKLLPKVSK